MSVVEVETKNLSSANKLALAKVIAAEAVRKVEDLVYEVAHREGESPLPADIFAEALLEHDRWKAGLEVDGKDSIRIVKALKTLLE